MNDIIEVQDMKFPVIEYGVTEAEIAEVAERYKDPDASTEEGYEHCKEGVQTLTAMRTAVEARRLDLKRPITKWIAKNVDGRAKTLIRQIRVAEGPVRAEKERVDEIKQAEARKAAEAEQARIDAIKENIAKIEFTAREQHPADTSSDYQTHITWLTELAITEEVFGEFVDEAKTVRDAALFKLTQWHDLALEREAADKKRAEEQAEIDRQKKKLDEREAEQKVAAKRIAKGIQDAADLQAETERKEREHEELRVAGIEARIDALRTYDAYVIGSSALRHSIKALENQTPTARYFAEFVEQAEAVRQKQLDELRQKLKAAEASEEQERRDEEARRPDKEKLVRWCEALDDVLRPEVLNDDAQKVRAKFGGELDKLLSKMYAAIEKL